MKNLLLLCFFMHPLCILYAQTSSDSLKKEPVKINADDPSQFFTRVEVYNELQHYKRNGSDFYLNQAIVRTVVKIGKKFTTRLDIPYVYNSVKTVADYRSSGIGDISFRLLGYRFLEKPKSAFTASVEISINTARSPVLGTGKNIIVPVVSYSVLIPKNKMLFALVLQQANAVSGDETRPNVSFTKIQAILIKSWTRRFWTVLAPEWYIDYVRGGLSMNLRSRATYAPVQRMNIWISPGAGMFGDFPGRYQWSMDIGARYFFLRSMNFNKKKNG